MTDGHGDDLYRYTGIKANFSSNITSLTDPTPLRRYLAEHIDCIGSYPEPRAQSLGRALADHHGLGEGELLVTSGATEAIYLVAQAHRGARAYLPPSPTFSEYADASQLYGLELERLQRLEPPQDAKGIYWLCNPNNPTGEVYQLERLEQLFADHPALLFVLDRSYSYFTEAELPEPRAILARYPNVLFIASLTKRFAMPGLRLGYLMGQTEEIAALARYRQPWGVGAMALQAGQWIVGEGFPELLDRDMLWSETERLRSALAALPGLRVGETETHFFLLELELWDGGHLLSATELKERLALDYGLLVRDCTNFGYQRPTLRIATQRPEQSELLIAALSELSARYALAR